MDIAERIDRVRAAVNQPIEVIYGKQEPMFYGAAISWQDGGPDPLHGISIYWNDVGPHWHYIGWGLSELDEKTAPNPNVSGFGYELTFRLAAPPELRAQAKQPGPFGPDQPLAATAAPTWPIAMLNTLARTMFERRVGFGPGQSIGFGAPPEPRLVACCFTGDPQLGMRPIETLNGKMYYLQVVGLVSRGELAAARDEKNHEPLYLALRGDDGLYLTRPERAPLF